MIGSKTKAPKLGINLEVERDRELARKVPENVMPRIPGGYMRWKKQGIRFYYSYVKTYWWQGKRLQKVLRYYGTKPPRQG
jgi:hypothetical protein